MTTSREQMEAIRHLNAGGVRARQIGEIVGVSLTTVHGVLTGKTRERLPSPREQFAIDAETGWAPLCLTDSEWAEWSARNPFGGLTEGEQAARPCTDCPLGFAADMRAQGRCNGTPGGVAADPDEPEEEDTVESRMQPDSGIRVAVALEAPCPACIKADVCSLRPLVEQLQSVAVMAPALDPLLGLQLVGTVTCAAFVKAKVRKAEASELEQPRKLKLTEEDRERRRQQALAMTARRRAAAAEPVPA